MDDKKFLKKVNLECALQKEPVKNLKDILNLHDEEWLSECYYCITKKDVDESKKSLVNKIYNKLTNEDVIHNFLTTIVDKEYNELTRIIKNNGDLVDNYIEYIMYSYLKNFGIVHTFNYKNSLHIVIADEIMNIIKKLDINKYQTKADENSKIVDLTYSMLNLYGVVPLDLLLENCCKYYDYNTFDEVDLDCIFLAGRSNRVRMIETEENLYIVKEEYLDEYDSAIIGKIIKKIEDDLFEFDFKEFDLDDLLKYRNMFYYEKTDSVLEFEEYLRDNGMNDYNINLLVGDIIMSFKKDYNEGIQFLNESFFEEKIEINEDNIDEILMYVNKVLNDISMWGNKGWTNKEIILGKCYE